METTLGSTIAEWLEKLGLHSELVVIIKAIIIVIVIIALAFLADFVARKIIISAISRIVKKSKAEWDDILVTKKVFNRLSHLAPALVIYYMIGIAIPDFPQLVSLIQAGTYIYMILISLLVIDSFLTALHEIYLTLPISQQRPIKGYVQIVKIFFYFIGIILILAVLMNKKPGTLLAGLGAVAAVLLLVFKDTILGFIASIQLSANQMVKPGDWISMPNQNTDGIVQEINLHTVKVQNWDQTISTIPTYSLVANSFINWKGMEDSGGRRIKRALNIDMKSIKFCDKKMLEKYKKVHYLKDYIVSKQTEIDKFNEERNIDVSIPINGRRLTNIGVFRVYIEEYLKNHPKIHKDMISLIRQLQPTEKGLPLEIYVFSNDQDWGNFERLQSDIFDHILSIISEFELNVFQNPSGSDFDRLVTRIE